MEEEHKFISSSIPFPMASAKPEYRLQTTISNHYWKEHLPNSLSKGKTVYNHLPSSVSYPYISPKERLQE